MSQHHRAVRGIYVTTSRYTSEAREWAKNSNIELIDGPDLERRFAAVDARGQPREEQIESVSQSSHDAWRDEEDVPF